MTNVDTVLDRLIDVRRWRLHDSATHHVHGVRLADGFMSLDSESRSLISSQIDRQLAFALLGLSVRLAEIAMNVRSTDLIDAAILMHIIEDFREDYRENIRHLVLVYAAAREIGVDVAERIRRLRPIASADTASRLDNFVGALPQYAAIDRFDVSLVRGENGYAFHTQPRVSRRRSQATVCRPGRE